MLAIPVTLCTCLTLSRCFHTRSMDLAAPFAFPTFSGGGLHAVRMSSGHFTGCHNYCISFAPYPLIYASRWQPAASCSFTESRVAKRVLISDLRHRRFWCGEHWYTRNSQSIVFLGIALPVCSILARLTHQSDPGASLLHLDVA